VADILAFDISNYLSPSAVSHPAEFRDFVTRARDEFNVRLWLVQGLTLDRWPNSQTSAQCEGILSVDGVHLAGYVYPYFDNGAGDAKRRLQAFNDYAPAMCAIALDLEDTTSGLEVKRKEELVDSWLEDCDTYLSLEVGREGTTVLYTGQGVWDGMQFPRSLTRWADRPVWWANYTGTGTLDPSMLSRGGFQHLVLHQFLGSDASYKYPIAPRTIRTGAYVGFDANIVDPAWLEEVTNMAVLPDVGDNYWSKFGPEGNNTLESRTDWPNVAKNLEGIITQVQQEVADTTARDTVESIRQVLLKAGYVQP